MMKKQFLPILLLLCCLSRPWAQSTVETQRIQPFKYRLSVKNDVPPQPLPGQDPAKAKWVNFWMFKDGFFSQADTLARAFKGQGAQVVELRRRGKYSGTPEPPHARLTLNVTDPLPAPAVPVVSNLQTGSTNRIQPQWPAARPNDTICVALIVRNPNLDASLSGATLKFRFPTAAFTYAGQVFSDQPGFTLRSNNPQTDAGDAQYAAGSVYTWDVGTLSRGEERVLFVCIKAKTDVRDSTFHDLWVEWSGALSTPNPNSSIKTNDNNNVVVVGAAAQTGSTTPPAVTFRGTSRTTISMNLARDPNALYVDPTALPPAQNVPPQVLTYTVHAENMGGAIANNLAVEVFLDERIDPASLVLLDAHFPSAPKMAQDFPTVPPVWTSPKTLRWNFTGINLQAKHGDEAAPDSQYTQASFTFRLSTRPGINLVAGQHIVARALLTMSTISGSGSSRTTVNDAVMTNPAIVRLDAACRGRLPFGHVFGVKGHLDLSGNGAEDKSQGVALTWRFPLVRPCGNSLSGSSLTRLPGIFWQVEAGWGNGGFGNPNNGQSYETRHVHFSPIQLRFYQKFASNPVLSYANISIGYSLDYTYYLAYVGSGSEIRLPSAFGQRLEQELFGSIGVSNLPGVPGYSIGVGYKQRSNRLVGEGASYGFPFAYVQIDVIRFRRHFAQVWKKTYYW